jgi:hypothetical protein
MIDLSSDGRHLLETHGNGQGAVWDYWGEPFTPPAWREALATVWTCPATGSGRPPISSRVTEPGVAFFRELKGRHAASAIAGATSAG